MYSPDVGIHDFFVFDQGLHIFNLENKIPIANFFENLGHFVVDYHLLVWTIVCECKLPTISIFASSICLGFGNVKYIQFCSTSFIAPLRCTFATHGIHYNNIFDEFFTRGTTHVMTNANAKMEYVGSTNSHNLYFISNVNTILPTFPSMCTNFGWDTNKQK
jgi:hypothetical protein